jgi:hypothetical protein
MPTTIPTTTSTTRPSASSGDAYFETDTNRYIIYDGSGWRVFNNDGVSLEAVSNSFSGSFNGSSDYLDVGTISTLSGATQQSVSFWFKSDVSGQMPDWGYRTASNKAFGFIDAGTNQKWFLARNGDTNSYELTSVLPSDTLWHHYVAVFNAGSVAVYIDGAEVSGTQTGSPPSSMDSTTGDFYIGKFGNIAYYADGLYDEFCIWNTALDSNDAESLYNLGTPIDPESAAGGYDKQASLTHWYRMGDHGSDTGTGGVANGNAITNVENAANPNTNDASVGGGSPTYSNTVAPN